MKKIILLLSTLVLSQVGLAQSQAQPTTKKYLITFESNWNKADHLATPGNAHFSPIVATTHNSMYDLLPLGGMAGNGLEQVAEIGAPADINKEINEAINRGHVGSALNTENMFINTMTTQSFEVEISADHPYLSFVSMIAPSPDWVVGVSNLKLFSKKNGFYQGMMRLPLNALDAGTEEGDFGGNFSINNQPTRPQQPINVLTGKGFDAPFAYVTIKPI